MAHRKTLPVYKRSLFSWVLSAKVSLQLILILIILATVFLRVLPLEILKRIVNDVLSVGTLSQLGIYCLIYLGAVLLTNALKMAMNALQTVISQKALMNMRRDFYQHILQLPLSFFRKTQPGSIVASLVNELAAASNFVGMAVAIPLSNILTLFAFGAYLIWLNPLLGLATMSIYPIALFVVPLIQRGVNKANKQRVELSRKMANQVAESVSGINEVHAQGSFKGEERKYNRLIERLRQVRITWSLYRYGVKVINNVFVGLGPVIVLTLGGYLVMQGRADIGSIVAFLAAQEKLYDPWKELIDFYQVYQDAAVSYGKARQAFEGESEFKLVGGNGRLAKGEIEIENLEFKTSEGILLLDQVNLKVKAGEHLALVGFSGSGKSTLVKCIGQLYSYTKGELRIDGRSVATLSKQEVISSIGFISQDPFIFSGTLDDNLLYSYHAVHENADREKGHNEPSLDDKIAALQQSGLFVDVLRHGLNALLKKNERLDLEEKFLRVRHNFQSRFGRELTDHVEFFEKDSYLRHASVAENLLFGTPLQPDFMENALSGNTAFLAFLERFNLRLLLLETGRGLLTHTVNILGNVPREETFFTQTPVNASDYDRCIEIEKKLKVVSIAELKNIEQQLLLDLSLRFVPAEHKVMALQSSFERSIMNGRRAFHDWCLKNSPNAISFFKDSEYIHSQSILNNIFYGSLTTDSPKVQDKVDQCIVFLLVEEDLLEQVVAIGLQFDVGSRGDKLSGGQQQKLAIARVLLKQPRVLLMDEATSALDNASQSRIQGIVENLRGTHTVISVIHRLDLLPSFDKVAVMKAGKIIEWGEPETLIADKGALHELVHGKRR